MAESRGLLGGNLALPERLDERIAPPAHEAKGTRPFVFLFQPKSGHVHLGLANSSNFSQLSWPRPTCPALESQPHGSPRTYHGAGLAMYLVWYMAGFLVWVWIVDFDCVNWYGSIKI